MIKALRMKIIFKIFFFIVILFVVSNSYSQDIAGVVQYKGIINEKFVDSFITALESKKGVSMHIKQLVIQDYHNAIPEDFELNFDNEESYYYLIPSLEVEGYNVGSNSDTRPYYTNLSADSIIYESLSFGNVAYNPLEWVITQETKKIGKYLCYKATAIERLFSRQGFYYNREAIAWFTTEIPVSFGPSRYSGLPGLILQVERDKFTLTATKINLHPDNKEIKIKRLGENDKVLSQEVVNGRIKEITEARKKEYGG